jgi:hypothetical protein
MRPAFANVTNRARLPDGEHTPTVAWEGRRNRPDLIREFRARCGQWGKLGRPVIEGSRSIAFFQSVLAFSISPFSP